LRGQTVDAPPEHRSGTARVAEREFKQDLARELHDQVARTLTGMLIELENFKHEQVGRVGVIKEASGLQDSIRQVLQSIREMLYDLRGESLFDESFVSSLESRMTRYEQQTKIPVELIVSPAWPLRLRSASAVHLHRLVEEALTNITLHSGARSVQVALDVGGDDEMAVSVRDDGSGMDASESGRVRGMGLLGMKERALLLGGHLSVETSPGNGTTVTAVIPKETLC
jgi:two-component system, NarL family, sensor histidine kinase UhpB